MAEPFNLVEQEDVALMARQFSQGAFQRKPKCGMSDSGARLGTRCGILPLLIVLRGNFFFPQAATARVVAGLHQDAEGPGNEARLPAETGGAALHFEERFLHGGFGIWTAS